MSKKVELICEKCGRDYPIWYAPSDIWNEVIRDEVAGDCYDFLCPTCFVVMAAMMGINPIWKISKDNPKDRK